MLLSFFCQWRGSWVVRHTPVLQGRAPVTIRFVVTSSVHHLYCWEIRISHPSWEIRPSQVLQLWDKDEHYYWIKEKTPLLISRLGTDSPLSHSTVNHDLFPYRQEHHCGITLSGAENETLGLILALLWVRLSSISPKTNHYSICL